MSDILKEFKEYLEENYDTTGEQNTISAYMRDVTQFIDYFEEHFGEKIVDFSRADYSEYKKHMTDDLEWKFSSINRKTSSLSIYENFLIEKSIRKNASKVIKKRDFIKIDMPPVK